MTHKSHKYSDFIVPLLRSLRDEIMNGYGKAGHDFKDDKSIVTEIDREVERKIVEALTSEFPDIGILGEELGQQGSTKKYWVIDPIDGTECYVRGLPGVTSIVGLVESGVIVQSYIYDLKNDVMYTAEKGKGAYANGAKVSVSSRNIKHSIIGLSDSYAADELINPLKDHGVFYVSKFYGRGIKSVYLASGRIEGNINISTRAGVWDTAPSRLLAVEAGAILTELDGGGLESKKYTLFSPNINDELLAIVKENIDV